MVKLKDLLDLLYDGGHIVVIRMHETVYEGEAENYESELPNCVLDNEVDSFMYAYAIDGGYIYTCIFIRGEQ